MNARATGWWLISILTPRCRSTRWDIASTSCCAGATRRRWTSDMHLTATASQTVGPYFRIGLEPLYISDLASSAQPQEKIVIQGRVVDGDCKPVDDAILEIWQANRHGRYAHPDDTQDKPLTEG